jgi:tetratricopeptide (TPR) repeat protein
MKARSFRWFAVSLLVVLLSSWTTLGKTRKDRLLEAQGALRNGDLSTAEQLFRSLLVEDQQSISYRLGLGTTLLKQKRLREAFDQAVCVLERENSSAPAHALLGSVFRVSGDFKRAIEHYRISLRIDPNAQSIGGLAIIDFYENRLNDSFRGLRRAVRLDDKDPDFYFHLAQVASKLERYDDSANAYKKFLNVAPRTDVNRRARVETLIAFLEYLHGFKRLYENKGSNSTVVALEVTGNLPVVTLHLNDFPEPFRFVLDTGSGMTVISNTTAERLNLKQVARGGFANAVGGQFEIVYGLLSSMEIGEVRIENVPVYIRPILDEANPIDGYIGLPVIAKFITTVDYPGRRFELTRLDSVNRDNRMASAFELPIRTTSGSFLSSEVSIGSLAQRFNFIIDTGASISVLGEELGAHQEVLKFKNGDPLRIYGAAGVENNVVTRLLPQLKLGSCVRNDVLAAVLNLQPITESAGFPQMGIIGGNFLSQFRVVFDLRRSVVQLLPPEQNWNQRLRYPKFTARLDLQNV